MKPKICASILPRNTTEALQLIEKSEQAHADILEVRLDFLNAEPDLAMIAANKKMPLIATDKATRGTSEHNALLITAAKIGFEYVDVDLASPNVEDLVSEAKSSGAKCIVSFHDATRTPTITELTAILNRQLKKGADISKIVTSAKKQQDNLTLLQFISKVSPQSKIVCFAMGELGKTSRLLSPLFGGQFTFASLDRGSETAPGQMTVQELRVAYEILGIE